MSSHALVPLIDRPRERLERVGVPNLTDVELLALVLGVGPPGMGCVRVAEELLARFGSLKRLSTAGIAEISSVRGVGPVQAARIKAALALAARLGQRPYLRGDAFNGPQDVFRRLGPRLAQLETEVFVAIALDARERVIFERQVAAGGACSVEIIPRDVFWPLTQEQASGVVFVHNHPSGVPEPSEADQVLTQRLCQAGHILGVRVVDHVIVARGGYHSFLSHFNFLGPPPDD